MIDMSKGAATRWAQLTGLRSGVLTRSQRYARWTIPSVCPLHDEGQDQNNELDNGMEAIGPLAVNNLANKAMITLFSLNRPFFRMVDSNAGRLAKLQDAANAGDDQAREALVEIDAVLSNKEREAMSKLDISAYRAKAVRGLRALIITGNTCIYSPPGKPAQVYNLHNFCVKRDASGNVVEAMTLNRLNFNSLKPGVQEQLRLSAKDTNKDEDAQDNLKLYTHIQLMPNGKYLVRQWVEEVQLQVTRSGRPLYFSKTDLPWDFLTWNLNEGESYGRGLVEEYAGTFNVISILTQALVELAVASADIKHFVNPASIVDIKRLNESRSGSFHMGNAEDITTLALQKIQDMQVVANMLERLEKKIEHAFLMSTAIQRDAERVTREEIRYMAQQLDMQYGGVYSHLAQTWQRPLAIRLVGMTNLGKDIEPRIITGLDSLSRNGDMENLAMAMGDMAILSQLPENVQQAIHIGRYSDFVMSARGVDKNVFMTDAEREEQSRKAREHERALMKEQTQQAQQVEAAKAAAQE